jgi:hypothetical protein
MYKYLVAFVLLTPLVGIWLVEGGEFAASVGLVGHENGASTAFAAYALTVAVVAWLSAGRSRAELPVPARLRQADANLRVFGSNLLIVSAVFLAIFLFGFGAINVWAGAAGKGEFRVGLGPLGAVPNLMTKFILPALLAYAAALYRKSSRSAALRRLLGANFALVFVIGASWGFKSTAFFVLLPALLIIYWRIRVATLVMLALVFMVSLMAFFFMFDASVEESADAQSFLFRRITVLQGDVSWFMWDQYQSGEVFPNYWPTLFAAFGDKFLDLAGLAREDFYTWTLYHYDLMISYLAGAPLDQIEEGHSITATPFSEGLVAGGVAGVAFFAVFAGLLVGRLHGFIQRSLARGHDARAAIASTYFCFHVFAWLNGGAVVQLFHISVWFSLGATVLAFKLMRRLEHGRTPPLPLPA